MYIVCILSKIALFWYINGKIQVNGHFEYQVDKFNILSLFWALNKFPNPTNSSCPISFTVCFGHCYLGFYAIATTSNEKNVSSVLILFLLCCGRFYALCSYAQMTIIQAHIHTDTYNLCMLAIKCVIAMRLKALDQIPQRQSVYRLDQQPFSLKTFYILTIICTTRTNTVLSQSMEWTI